jgi:hypothetical protein
VVTVHLGQERSGIMQVIFAKNGHGSKSTERAVSKQVALMLLAARLNALSTLAECYARLTGSQEYAGSREMQGRLRSYLHETAEALGQLKEQATRVSGDPERP